ncbi:SulP family inorganic anion transporter [Geomesophilobacter sediminis]|uniref:SulP family inorganic anion transporter n=1 Tax=Geomesophilobacter sediminis TaxID=2798584 RepID=A0A8J7S7V2_9BACT|nr:SulP family inorganic anion transporter [Geomesophilobacter sediminis]MBJ6727241.1 SulP family inorganic anion transporter [Geomesophilobacter sediminis]
MAPDNGNEAQDRRRGGASRLARLLPIVGWLPEYRTPRLSHDLFAGVTLAAYAVPVALAYSVLAGVNPQIGLYCYIASGLVYALFATSRHLAIGPTAAISVMVASVVGGMAGNDPALYASMTAVTAVMVAVICLLAWALRLNSFVNFISETILIGFKAGAALSIAVTQLPKLFGLPGGGENFFRRIEVLTEQLPATNPVTLGVGAASLAILLVAERYFPRRPFALAVVAVSTLAVSLFGLTGAGVQVVGSIPAGLPPFHLPRVGLEHLEGLSKLAFACFLLSYVESIAAARTFAAKHGYAVDSRQELLGLGAANLIAGLGQGYPVAGGLSQSAVNEGAGARTPLSLFFASITLILVLFWVAGLLTNLPQAVLAAIVLAAISRFVSIADFRRLWRISRTEFNIAVVAFFSVLCFGILNGVLVSAIASILFLLRLMSRPHVAVLGRIPGSSRFSDVQRHPDNELVPGLFLFRVEAPLLYFNVENIDRKVIDMVHSQTIPVQLVVCDLSNSPYIDAAGARMLAQLEEKLSREGVRFRVAEAHAEVRDILRVTGVDRTIGGVNRHISLANLVDDFQSRLAAAAPGSPAAAGQPSPLAPPNPGPGAAA